MPATEAGFVIVEHRAGDYIAARLTSGPGGESRALIGEMVQLRRAEGAGPLLPPR
ncbi:hypothetical protein [Streptomyces sp. NPDC088755]|uniref:hypothetical protein n=1 Tax=Streptomyces sp. NPDC088755 TaxID=3365888 RepID=UPI003820ECAC